MNGEKDTFEIAFDAKKYPGKIEAVQVTLRPAIMKGADTAHLALCEHPLYSQLWRYCQDNKPRSIG